MGETRILRDEVILEQAESVLDDWAAALAEADRDSDAAEAIRMKTALCRFRCSFLERDKYRAKDTEPHG